MDDRESAEVEVIARRDGQDFSTTARRLMAYGARHMPRHWTPSNDTQGGSDDDRDA